MAKYDLPSYRPSGGLNPLSLALFAALAVAGIAAAFVYQLLMNWIPIIQLKFLATLGFGAALGAGAMFSVNRGHLRNKLVAAVLTLAVSGTALAASYYWDYRRALSQIADKEEGTTVDQLKEELPLGKYLELKKKMGWKMKRGGSVEGGMVTFLWVLEAVMVLGLAAFMGVGASMGTYCEKCKRWCESHAFAVWGRTQGDAEPFIKSGDLGALAGIEGGGTDRSVNLTFTLEACTGCRDTGFLTVEEKRVSHDKKGRQKTHGVTLIHDAILSAEQLARAADRVGAVQGQKLPG